MTTYADDLTYTDNNVYYTYNNSKVSLPIQYTYTINEGDETVTITNVALFGDIINNKYDEHSLNITIPSIIDKKKVTALSTTTAEEQIFCSPYYGPTFNLYGDITIPEGVETLGSKCFDFVRYKSINIPTTVKTIGAKCFADNTTEGVTITFDNIESSQLESIGAECFSQNKIEFLAIPVSKLTSVGINVVLYSSSSKTNNSKLESIILVGDPAKDSSGNVILTKDDFTSLITTYNYYNRKKKTTTTTVASAYYPAEYAADYANLTSLTTINRVSTSNKAYFSYTVNEDGSIAVITEPAQVIDADGNTVGTYASLADAINGAEAGQTVQLLADITDQDTTLTINKSLTLDLNGHTLSGEGGKSGNVRRLISIAKGGGKDVIIKSSVEGGKIAVSAAETGTLYAISLDGDDSKTLTLESGTISATNTESGGITCGLGVDVTNTLNVKNATVTAKASKGSSIYGISGSGSTRGWRATINMEGGSVSAESESGTSYGLNVNGKLNMTGGTVSSSSKNGTYGVYLGSVADATISGGEISASANYNCYGVNVGSGATACITSGTITSTAENNVAYGVASYGETTISGGSITAEAKGSSAYGVTAYAATTTISDDAVVTATAATELAFATCARETGTLQLDGGTMTGTATNRYAYAADIESMNAKINVTGGKYSYSVTGTESTAKGHFLNTVSGIETSQVSITGGYYPDNTEAKSYLASGYGFYDLTGVEGYSYEVAPVVAQIGTTVYKSLPEAFAAAPTGTATTIKLLKDANGSGVALFTKSGTENLKDITLDLGGHTYTMDGTAVGSTGYESQAFHFEKGSKVTIKNGRLTATSGSMLIQNYSDLTLTDVTLDESEHSNINYVISNNFGSLTTTGNTIIKAAEGKVAFDVWYGMSESYADGVTINLNDGTTIDGKIEYGASSDYGTKQEGWEDKAVLNINGGTFTNFAISLTNSGETAYDANINIKGGTFDTAVDEDYCAADFVPAETTDSLGNVTYGVTAATVDNAISYKESETGETKYMTGSHITIDDTGSNFYSFNVPTDMTGKTITYTRKFSNTNYKAWFVPFEVSAVNDSVEFYELANVNSTVDENQVNSGNWYIVLNPVTSGTVEANKPYVIKPKYAGKVTFTVENATIYKLGENGGSLSQTTLDSKVKLTLKGNYETKTVSADDNGWYAFSSGKFSLQTTNSIGHTLPPMRFYLTITDADGNSISSAKNYQINMFVDDDPTGISGVETNVEPVNEVIYDLQGRSVTNPSKGIYIINGKKVIIK